MKEKYGNGRPNDLEEYSSMELIHKKKCNSKTKFVAIEKSITCNRRTVDEAQKS